MVDKVDQCEQEIISRLQSQLPYLASCEDVGNIQTAIEVEQIVAPAIRMMFSGDTPNEPMSLSIARQLVRLKWSIYVIASSFGPTIEGRRDTVPSGTGTEKGIYTMLADVKGALLGFALPSQAPFVSKLFYMGAEPWSIGESSVVYVSRWFNSVIETGA